VIALERCRPLALRSVVVRVGLLGEGGVVDGVPSPDHLLLAAGREEFEGVLADRLQQEKAAVAERFHEARVDQRRKRVELGTADVFCSLDRERACENAEAAEESPLLVGQQLGAPLHGRPQSAMTLRGVPRPARQQR